MTDSPADLGATPTAYLPFFSARGCTQTLTLLNAPSLRRTVNGRLVSFSNPLLKYTSVISCQDKSPVACDGLWVGAALRVDCIQYLACAVAREVNRLTLGRELVEGSGILQDTRRNEYPLQQIGAKEVIYSPLSEGGFLHYRPRLKMLLADYQLKTDVFRDGRYPWKRFETDLFKPQPVFGAVAVSSRNRRCKKWRAR